MVEDVAVKTRRKDPETGQWVKLWPAASVPAPESVAPADDDHGKATRPAENKARKAAPENKAAR